MNLITLILVLVLLIITIIIYKIIHLMMEIRTQNLDNPLDDMRTPSPQEHFDVNQLDIEKMINQKIEAMEVSKKKEQKKNPTSLITTEELDI